MDEQRARQLLIDKRDDLRRLSEERTDTGDLGRQQQDSTGELSSHDQHPGDAGTETFERTRDLAIEEQFESELREVQEALQRLDDGTYGRCQECGCKIADERLEIRPQARYCVEHQREMEEPMADDRGMGIGQEIEPRGAEGGSS